MDQNFNIINFSEENKFIYIHSYLHPFKGVAIAPVPFEQSVSIGPHQPGKHYFRTYPIVGEDWQVIDDEWYGLDMEYGFEHMIVGSINDILLPANRAFIYALKESTDIPNRHTYILLKEAEQMGVTFSDEKCFPVINLHVKKSTIGETYIIGNTFEIEQVMDEYETSYDYPVADVYFRFDEKETPDTGIVHIFTHDELHNYLQKNITGYSDFFHRTHIQVCLNFEKEVPLDVRKKLKVMIHKLNDYLRLNDEMID